MSNKVNSYLFNNLFNSNSNCIFFSKNINYINYIFLIVVNSFIFIINRVLLTNTNFTDYRKKTLAAIFEQLIRCGIYSTFVFLLSNLSKNYNNIIAIISFITCIIYTVISEYFLFSINTSLSTKDIGALIISCIFILILVATIILNLYKSSKCRQLINYIILIILILLLLVVPYYFLPKHNKEYVYLHHWYFCMILALLFRYDGLVNNIIIGILLGLMVHGLSSYGDDFIIERQIFLNKNNNTFSFSDKNFDFDRDTYFKIVVKKK